MVSLVSLICPYVKACWKGGSNHWRPQKSFLGGGNVDISLMFQVADVAMQMDVYKKLYCFYTTKKMPHESTRSVRICFEIFFKWSCSLYEFARKVEPTFWHPLQLLLNWRINVVIIVNAIQLSLKWTWIINNYVCGSPISLCWLNRPHFWNLLSELFYALPLSEMLFLFINCLLAILASTFYK